MVRADERRCWSGGDGQGLNVAVFRRHGNTVPHSACCSVGVAESGEQVKDKSCMPAARAVESGEERPGHVCLCMLGVIVVGIWKQTKTRKRTLTYCAQDRLISLPTSSISSPDPTPRAIHALIIHIDPGRPHNPPIAAQHLSGTRRSRRFLAVSVGYGSRTTFTAT